MKKGDIVVCIDDFPYSFNDDLYWDENEFIIKYNEYKITNINEEYTELEGESSLNFNPGRFVSTQEYRKMKLKKLNIFNEKG